MKEYKEFVDSVISTDYDDFRPGGKRRLELGVLVLHIRAIASMVDDPEFKKDLAEYLDFIEYDPDQIQRERDVVIQELLKTEGAIEVISGIELTKRVPML